MFNIQSYLEDRRQLVDKALDQHLPSAKTRPHVLHEAMRHSIFAGGKRIRPILCMAAAGATGAEEESALIPGLAVELLHTYSLVHDDLPAMDDDDLRRGKPTCHIAFGEANAILAGDALLTLAFELLAGYNPTPAVQTADMVIELAQAAGSQGMVAGQIEDMQAEGASPTDEQIRYIHAHKTGALICASLRLGGMAGSASDKELEALSTYGADIGLAFQIADDLLNETSTPEVLGKPVGSDDERRKVTAVAVYGAKGARKEASRLVKEAIAALAQLPGRVEHLEALAKYVIERVS